MPTAAYPRSPEDAHVIPVTTYTKEMRDILLDQFDEELRRAVTATVYADFDPGMSAKHVEIARGNVGDDAFTYMKEARRKPVLLDHWWTAKIGTEVVNRATGEITVVPERAQYTSGDVNMRHLARRLGPTSNVARKTLVALGMLTGEVEAKIVPMVVDPDQTKPEYSERLRLTEWAVKMGYGRRTRGIKGFGTDWVTPSGVAYIEAMLAIPYPVRETAPPSIPQRKPKAIEVIQRLLEGNPSLRQTDIVRITGFSKMTVHRTGLLRA